MTMLWSIASEEGANFGVKTPADTADKILTIMTKYKKINAKDIKFMFSFLLFCPRTKLVFCCLI